MHPKIVKIFIIWAIVLAVFLGLDWFIANITHQPMPHTVVVEQPSRTTTASSTVSVAPSSTLAHYFCAEGQIAAVFASGTAAIDLSDGRTFVLPQAISADGGRYASGTMVFWSKGNNAFVTEGPTTTYSNCVAGSVTVSGSASSTFTDNARTFSFTYPNSLKVFGGDGSYTTDWEQQATTSGMILAQVAVPGSVQPKTNFDDAQFTVGVSSDPEAVQYCDQAGPYEYFAATRKVMINGVEFSQVSIGNAGMSQTHDTTSFRVVHGGECFAVEYTIHATTLSVFDPSYGYIEYDHAKVQNMLEAMVHSFVFLQ